MPVDSSNSTNFFEKNVEFSFMTRFGRGGAYYTTNTPGDYGGDWDEDSSPNSAHASVVPQFFFGKLMSTILNVQTLDFT